MLFKSESHRKAGQIKVTHYVSPHEFWFKYVDDETESADNEIQQRIQRLGNVSQNHYNHSPLAGEIVIVRYCFGAVDKFIRARVDVELKYNAGSEFVLWAIDEGFPIRSRKKWITKLTSADLQNDSSCVFKGTLNDVVPATEQFNFMDQKSEIVKTNCWSIKAIDQFEKISNAESLIFYYDCHAAEQHLYGSVEVMTFSGKRVKMSQVLKELDEAIDATNFEKEYQQLVHKDYWHQEQENYKIKENFKGDIQLSQPDVKAPNTEANSLCQQMEDCNLSEVPLNKRYNYHCSKLNASQPRSTSEMGTSNVSTSSTVESLDDSFHSAALTFSHQSNNSIPKFHFKKALQQDSGFSTPQKERVLLHCPDGVYVEPIKEISESHFTDEVLAKLKSMGRTDIRRIQAVAWPHLMRTHSLVVINAARTGKTWSYLPAVCSLLMETYSDDKIFECEGPVMIIICLDSSAVNTVDKHCRNLLSNQYLCEAYVQNETKDIQYKMLNGIDILITTIPGLLRLMKHPLRLFNKKRIKTIVFDEIDTMRDRFGESDIETVYRAFLVDTKIQVVVTSKTWHKTLRKFCQKDDVLLCIGAYIEAAIYSNVEITVQTISEEDRYGQFLSHFTKRNYIDEATIIICSESHEVLAIEQILRSRAYAVTFCHDKTDSSKINEINREIKQNLTDQVGVFVCTDDVLGDLNIRHAQHIIHFSLPKFWTDFTKRFIASFDYYENLVQDRSSVGKRPTSVVFVGGECEDSMPRLIEFMRLRCFAKVPEHILKLAEKKRIERDEKRLTKYRPFCANILLLGACHNQYSCDARHILTQFDRPHKSVPLNGFVKFHVSATHSPAHFTVRLLAHRPLEGKKWQKMPHVDDYLSFQNQFNEYFDNAHNHEFHPPPLRLGDLCAIIDDDEKQFERCQIIGIGSHARKPHITVVDLLLIDSNVTMTSIEANELLALPAQFRDFPPQAVDIRIAGVVPLDLDTTWNKTCKDSVKRWFKDNEKCQIQAKIELTLMNCIWVKTVELIEKLPAIDGEVMVLDIKKTIIKKKLGVTEDKSLQRLREMAKQTGILATEPCTPQPDLVTLKKEQERGRGRGKVLSNSSSESLGSINLPRRSHSNVMSDASVNDCLTPSKSLATKSTVAPPEKKVCPIAEQWESLAPDTFNEIDIGQFYSPARFYVLLASKFKSFKALMREIHEFTNDSKNLKPLANVEVGQVCLAYADAIKAYGRAKIVKVDRATVKIFLVDYGEEQYDVPLTDLLEIPQNLIERLPFQAILCKMVGIRPINESQEWSDDACEGIYQILSQSDSKLFVQSTGVRSVTNDNIKCFSYDAIYLNKALEQNVNQLVASEGFAEFEPETQHFTDLIFDWSSLSSNDDAEEENWDNDDDDRADIFDAGRFLAEDESKLPLFHSSGDESDKELDVDIQFTEDQLKEWLGLPKDSKFVTPDNQLVFPSATKEVAKEKETSSSTENAQIATTTSIECDEPHAGERDKLVQILDNQLVHPAKMPYIVWKQTESTITITIEAPDVKDYSLKVGSRYVHFSFIVNQERLENILNLFGCVDAKFTSHEVRGLNLIVRLKKTLAALHWPRLEQSPDRNRFIKCKVDECEDSDDNYEIGHGRNVHKTDSDSSSFSDNDDNLDLSDLEL